MPTTLPVTSGLIADYTFDEGSGSTVHDRSGGGNDFAFGASVPTWSPAGLSFTGTAAAQLPVALASIRSVVAVVNHGKPDGSNYGFCPFLGTSTANDRGQWWFTAQDGSAPGPFAGYPAPSYTEGSTATAGQVIPGIPCMVTWITDPSVPFGVYFDDVPAADITGGPAADPATRTGNLWLGNTPAFGFTPNFVVSRLALFSRVLSGAEITSLKGQLYTDQAGRGSPLGQANPSTANVLSLDGDSITAGYLVTTAQRWANNLSTTLPFDQFNFGVTGQTVANIDAKYGPRRRSKLVAPGAKSLQVIFAGTNDVAGTNSALISPALAALDSAVGKAKAAGFDRVVVVPMLSRGDGSGGPYDANKAAYNNGIRSAYAADPRVVLVPDSALPALIPDGAYLNTTYFNSDQCHPTAAGHTQLAAAISSTINGINYAPIVPPTVASVVLASSLVSTPGTVSGSVTLSAAAPAGGVAVALTSSDAAVTVPASVTVVAGSTSANFTAAAGATAPARNPVTISAALNSSTASAPLSAAPALGVPGSIFKATIFVEGPA